MPLVILLIGLSLFGCTESLIRKSDQPLIPVAYVDVNRYLGTWYEIASRPNRFQKGCVATKATYTLTKEGTIAVLNECRDKTLDGKVRSANGKAWIVDPASNSKLKVVFFWPFSGNYWIIDLGSNYEYSVVGEPDGKYIWILSRKTQMTDAVFEGILSRLKDRGYSTEAIVKTPQPGN